MIPKIKTHGQDIDRRKLLAAFGSFLMAGCTSSGGADSPEQTPSPTPSSTPTSTPTPTPSPTESATKSQEVNNFQPVVSKISSTDAVDSQSTTGFGKGSNVFFGTHATIPVHDGALDISAEVTVSQNGTEIEAVSYDPKKELPEQSVPKAKAFWHKFGSIQWSQGAYNAELRLRDDITGKIVETSTDFSITEPLGSSEVTVVSKDIPENIAVGESFSYTLTFRNETNRGSSIVSPISARYGEDEYQNTGTTFRFNLAPNSTRTYKEKVTFDQAGNLDIRFNAIDLVISFPIEE